ncbi:hepatic sodium/bile acid cotransporter-like [Nerophis ophidion]|uniref:hepatic sodium/bile acid cotransporter-like n=1 Tax=Nerophis ophidion TaxID=159077 RepID=UPI002ADF1A51|nr:hepatic sodium/bile acid cotransporter-like [Nerophis ophidion]
MARRHRGRASLRDGSQTQGAYTVHETMDVTIDTIGGRMSDSDAVPSAFNMTPANTSDVVFESFLSPALDKTINVLMVMVLFITMVSLGCTMEVSKIKDHIVNPKGVVIAVVSQYCIMPLTAFCLAKAFQLADMTAVVVLICGCCPGGSLSNILALALQGDMNLSIVMTSCSTLLALGMMPLLLFLYCQSFDNLQSAVPYVDIAVSLVMILVPCGIGIVVNYYRPRYAKIITKVGLIIMSITATGVTVAATIAIGGAITAVMSPPLLATGALMPLIGFTFGYVISAVFKLSQPERRTVAMETGCQNIQLCSTILKLAFPPEVIGPLFLFPMVYISFQLLEAMVLIVVFRCHQRLTRKEKGVYQTAVTHDGPKASCEGTV